MSDFPTLQKRLVPFRGGASSDTFNTTVEETFYDINNLFNLVDEQDLILKETQEIFTVQNLFQQVRMTELQTELDDAKAKLQALTAGTLGYKDVVPLGVMSDDPLAQPIDKAQIDGQYNVLTLPMSGEITSKIYLYDDTTKRSFLPKSLKVEPYPKADGRLVTETDVLRAFDGDENTYWHRKCYYDISDTIGQVKVDLYVTLPDDIISSRDVNMISLNPFPLNTLSIESVEYRLNGEWTLIPGFPTDTLGNPIPYTNAGFLKFYFPRVPVGEVRIRVSQRHWVTENHQKVFHVGLQEVGVYSVEYQSGIGKLQIPMKLKGKAGSHMITGIVPNFANEGALSDKTVSKSDIFTYTVYQLDAQGQMNYTKDSLPIVVSSDTIMIKAAIFRDPYTQVTPALQSVTVTYKDA